MTTRPQNLEAERLLLGQWLSNPEEVLMAVKDAGVLPHHFYRDEHRQLAELLLAMVKNGDDIDAAVTVPDRVMRNGPHRYGGIAYVLELPDRVPATANAGTYIREILDTYSRRTLMDLLDRAMEGAVSAESADEVVQQLVKDAQQMEQPGRVSGQWLSDLVSKTLDENHAMVEAGGQSAQFRSPWADVEAKVRVMPTDLVIIAGRPGMGKSSFVFNWLMHRAKKGDCVGMFSLEMGRRQIAERTLTMETRVPLSRVIDVTQYGQKDWDKFTKLETKLAGDAEAGDNGLPFLLDTRGHLTLSQMATQARRWVRLMGCKALVVDYLQLMSGDDPRERDRQKIVSQISRGLKVLAKDLNVPIFALSQLSRGVEERNPPRPVVADLRESGAIEQDADIALLLYRPGHYPKHRTPDNRRLVEVIIDKQRMGQRGTARLNFYGEVQTFKDVDPPKKRAPAKKSPPPKPEGSQLGLPKDAG